MKSLVITLALIFCSISLSAQFGFRAKYNSNSYAEWEELIPSLSTSNVEVGLDYWFKLKTRRIEFMPEIYYGLTTTDSYPGPLDEPLHFEHGYFGFQFNTHIYILDLESDCDCPTFSKDGPSFKKGFFFNVAPGIVYNRYDRTVNLSTGDQPRTRKINPRVVLGAGYDIGITDLLTITPFINYALSFANDAEVFTFENELLTSNWTSLQAGIRVGFRPDYVKQYGR